MNLPFNQTPGTKLYYSDYSDRLEEECKGGMVFPLGEKISCKECASTCAGCIEMAVNFGFILFQDVKHLIQKPELLNKKYQEQLKA